MTLPCHNCQEYEHTAPQYSKPQQKWIVYKQVEVLPRDQTTFNYGHSTKIENLEKLLLEVGLPDRIEESVLRIATHSSTKNRLVDTSSNKKSRTRKSARRKEELESDPSNSQQSDEPRKTQPIATSKNGVGTSRISKDISEEVRQELTRSNLPIPHPRVRFNDTPIFIEPERCCVESLCPRETLGSWLQLDLVQFGKQLLVSNLRIDLQTCPHSGPEAS